MCMGDKNIGMRGKWLAIVSQNTQSSLNPHAEKWKPTMSVGLFQHILWPNTTI